MPFHEEVLGLVVVDEVSGVTTRLRSPGGRTTLALHMVDPGMRMD